MAYIKLNNGSIKSVDDDELKSLITAGAGEETNSPTDIPSLLKSENENGQTTLEPITPNNLDILGTAKQYISGIGGTSQSPQEINRAQYLSRNPKLQGDNTGINQKAKDYNPTIGNFGKAVVDIGSYLIPYALPLTSGGFLTNALIQGLGGGAINTGSQYIDEGKINPKEVAVNALASGLLGGVAGKLYSNIENKINTYNGENKVINRVIDDLTNDINLIDNGIVPSDEARKKILARANRDEYIPPINSNINSNINNKGIVQSYEARKKLLAEARKKLLAGIINGDECIPPINSNINSNINDKVDLGIVKKEMATKKYHNAFDPEKISDDAAMDYYAGLRDKLIDAQAHAQANALTYPTLINNPYEGINGNTFYQKAKNNIIGGILKYPIKGVNALYSDMLDILNVARIPGNIGTNALTTGLFDKFNSQ